MPDPRSVAESAEAAVSPEPAEPAGPLPTPGTGNGRVVGHGPRPGRRGLARSALASLRVRLLLLVLLAVLPALGLILYGAAEQRRQAADTVQAEGLRLARLAAGDQEDLNESSRQLLIILARLPAVRDRDAAACSALFAELLRLYPRYANLGVAGADGEIFCSALPLGGPVNVADRSYFQRALQTRDFAIGDYQIGRISNRAAVNVGFPILDEVGRVRAVVFAALDLGWLNLLAARAQLPPGSTLTVVDRDGVVLVRLPDPEGLVGRAPPAAPPVKPMRGRRASGPPDPPGLAGAPRLSAFA